MGLGMQDMHPRYVGLNKQSCERTVLSVVSSVCGVNGVDLGQPAPTGPLGHNVVGQNLSTADNCNMRAIKWVPTSKQGSYGSSSAREQRY